MKFAHSIISQITTVCILVICILLSLIVTAVCHISKFIYFYLIFLTGTLSLSFTVMVSSGKLYLILSFHLTRTFNFSNTMCPGVLNIPDFDFGCLYCLCLHRKWQFAGISLWPPPFRMQSKTRCSNQLSLYTHRCGIQRQQPGLTSPTLWQLTIGDGR